MRHNVAVIILNYGRWRDSLDCANSVLASEEAPSQVIIVDNASPDDSLQRFRQWLNERSGANTMASEIPSNFERLVTHYSEANFQEEASIRIIGARENRGYAAGNNIGMRLAFERGAEACWILNNDTLVAPQALGAMRQRLFHGDGAGLCGSIILYAEERDKVQCCAGGFTNIWTGLSVLPGRGMLLEEARSLAPHTVESGLNFIYGASVMATRTFCECVGFMDENFFLYCEEQDWAWRGLRLGFSLAYAPDAFVWHKEGATTGMNQKSKKWKLQLLLIRSRLLLAWKHCPMAIPVVVMGCAYAAGRQILRRKGFPLKKKKV